MSQSSPIILPVLKKAILNLASAFTTVYKIKDINPPINFEKTNKIFEGEFTFILFPYLKTLKLPPEVVAKQLGEFCCNEYSSFFKTYNVVKGFLNFTMSDYFWFKNFEEICVITLSNDSRFNRFFNKHPDYQSISTENTETAKIEKEVILELSSPNTNKPLHLGHLRNIFLGNSVSNIISATNTKVHKVQIVNDRGIHICKSMVAWKKFGNNETPQSTKKKGDHFVGTYYVKFDQEYKKEVQSLIQNGMEEEEAKINAPLMIETRKVLKKWENKDKETLAIWKKMNQWVYDGFEKTYQILDTSFDKSYYESNTYLLGREVIVQAIKNSENKAFYKEEDGSVWADLTAHGLDKKILIRADGTTVYMTQDIGTAIQRYNDFPNTSQQIYTVGNEQEYHFKVLFNVLDLLGYQWAKENYHLSYGMVELPEGKMKSREGTVVDADDLCKQMIKIAKEKTLELGKIDGFTKEEADELHKILGLGALKYYILKVAPAKNILFNPKESIDFQGNTAPFIQYTYARIASILRKAKKEMNNLDDTASILVNMFENSNSNKKNSRPLLILEKSEKKLIQQLLEWHDKLIEASQTYSPAIIANYAFELAKAYNKFYNELSIFKAEKQEIITFRIYLSLLVGAYIKQALKLLGIDVPEQM